MLRLHPLLCGTIVLLLSFLPRLAFSAEAPECPPDRTLLASDDPAYSDAMQLAQSLGHYGFIVNCMFPTKLGSMF